jgi:hypothetical protein
MAARPRYTKDDDEDDGYDDDDRGYAEPHRGTMILVLGILSLLVCGLLGPVAWAMGSTDLKKMQAGQMDASGRGETQAGYICGIVATILMGIGLVFVVLWFVMFAAVIGGAAAPKGR